jgi:hypothetical protein
MTSKTAHKYLPSRDPAVVAAKRVSQARLAEQAKEAMDKAAMEVARKGVAAQVMLGARFWSANSLRPQILSCHGSVLPY